jgi:hypothetical protein
MYKDRLKENPKNLVQNRVFIYRIKVTSYESSKTDKSQIPKLVRKRVQSLNIFGIPYIFTYLSVHFVISIFVSLEQNTSSWSGLKISDDLKFTVSVRQNMRTRAVLRIWIRQNWMPRIWTNRYGEYSFIIFILL